MRLIALIAVAVLVLAGASAISSTLVQSGTQSQTVNETWTPDPGNVTVLDNSKITGAYYNQTVSVYDENGTPQTAGTDYVWYDSNGTVKALQSGGLDGDSSANITYGWSETSSEQRNFADTFASGFEIAQLLILVLGAGLVLAGISVLGRVS